MYAKQTTVPEIKSLHTGFKHRLAQYDSFTIYVCAQKSACQRNVIIQTLVENHHRSDTNVHLQSHGQSRFVHTEL